MHIFFAKATLFCAVRAINHKEIYMLKVLVESMIHSPLINAVHNHST